jgi:hypothetical protein
MYDVVYGSICRLLYIGQYILSTVFEFSTLKVFVCKLYIYLSTE